MSDTSGGYSDQQIRDIVAALSPAPEAAPAQGAPMGILPPAQTAAPEMTPTMTYGTPAPGAPMSILTPAQVAPVAAPKKEDDWAPPAPTMVAPPVAPLGTYAAQQRPRAPTMGVVLGAGQGQ